METLDSSTLMITDSLSDNRSVERTEYIFQQTKKRSHLVTVKPRLLRLFQQRLGVASAFQIGTWLLVIIDDRHPAANLKLLELK